MSKYYITTPIYYVNDVPHIGHAYTTIAADVLARYHRLKGEKVFFLTGTDEHGQKIADAAAKAGKKPKDFVDGLIPSFKDAWKLLNISYDHFIRTTDDHHQKAVLEIIKLCEKNGDIYLGEYEGLYCKGCERYYLERDLVDGKCPMHLTAPIHMKEESYFFKLGKYQDKLLEFYKANPGFLSPSYRAEEIINRVKEDLKDLSVSRTNLSWGIPFPVGTGHVTYVWFDALTNYISGIGWPQDMKKFNQLWPADCHLIAKDISWFHEVIWPAMLMSAGIELPKKVFVHGFLTVEGQKMSKSLGNFITPQELVGRFGVDPTRYFLLSYIPFGQDGDFSEAQLVTRVNGEIADAYGNLLSRVATLVEKNFQGQWPASGKFTELENDIEKAANELESQVDKSLAGLEFNKALEQILGFLRAVNKYMTETQPWKITDKDRLGTVLYTVLEGLRVGTNYLAPFIPATTENAAKQLGQKISLEHAKFDRDTKGVVKKGEVLQKKLEAKKQDSPFAKLNLRVAHVVTAAPHPDADKLLVLKINLGNEERTLCAGLKAFYKPEELVGKHIVVVSNLKPAKLRGIVSQGMLLAADKNGVVKVLEAPGAEPGAPVTLPGVKPNTQEITIDDVMAIKLTTRMKKTVFDGQQLVTPTGDVVVDIEDGATIR
jgi:methionyl-tRNA synthetase